MTVVDNSTRDCFAQSSTFLLMQAGTRLATYLHNQEKVIDRLTQEWSNVCESITTNAEGLKVTIIPVETFNELHQSAVKARRELTALLNNENLLAGQERKNFCDYLQELNSYIQKVYDIVKLCRHLQ